MTDGNWTYCGDHFEMQRNSESLNCVSGTNIVLQVNYTSQTNKQTWKKKKKRFSATQVWKEERKRALNEGGQMVKTSSYKSQNCNVQHDNYNYHLVYYA